MQLPFRLFFSSPSLRVEIQDEPCRPCICEEKVIPLNTNWNKYFFFLVTNFSSVYFNTFEAQK